MTGFLLPHVRQRCFDDVQRTEVIGFKLVLDQVQGLLRSRKLLYRADKGFLRVST
jgi:hypothetical protein